MISVCLPGFFLADLTDFLRVMGDGSPCRYGQPVGRLFQPDFLAGYGNKGREGGDSFPERRGIFVGDGIRIGGGGNISDEKTVFCETGGDGNHLQVVFLHLERLGSGPLDGPLERGEAAELVRIFVEDGFLFARLVIHQDTPPDREGARDGRVHREGLGILQDDGMVFLLGAQDGTREEKRKDQTVPHCFFRTMVQFSMPTATSQKARRSGYSAGRTRYLSRIKR